MKQTCQRHRSVKKTCRWQVFSVGRTAMLAGSLLRKRDNAAKLLSGTSVGRAAMPPGSLWRKRDNAAKLLNGMSVGRIAVLAGSLLERRT